MKLIYPLVKPAGYVSCRLPDGTSADIPVVAGLLKHLTVGQLSELLPDIDVLRKYTVEALKHAPWKIVREFPRSWLICCLAQAELPADRRAALEFMLSAA